MADFSDVEVSIDDCVKIFMKPVPANCPPYDAHVRKTLNARLNTELRQYLKDAVLPTGNLPANRMSLVVRVFLESIDFETAYSSELFRDLLKPSVEVVEEASVALATLQESSIEELTSMGLMGVGLLSEVVLSYIVRWTREEKWARIYSLPTFAEKLKAADTNHLLMTGQELPPGFSERLLGEAMEKVGALTRSWPKVEERNIIPDPKGLIGRT